MNHSESDCVNNFGAHCPNSAPISSTTVCMSPNNDEHDEPVSEGDDADPCVSCVVLLEHGEMKEVQLVHSDVHKYLGGKLCIVGALPEIDVVAVGRVDAKKPNAFCLPRASFEPNIRGDIVLVRTRGQRALPVDLHEADVRMVL